ncbi:trypsin-like serine peptidase [Glycomyces buryatensis]|uniref:Trypsin-like peptidase domain-containing protein n=1 Tax=Glycomyces buryatensis TaxID=2570927 RepID=A0A4S8QRM6_9ACTN|nr:serine protease [Glycomyces buryatensis]THV43304.1 trypsin-like peptidase domain-containing protein [Glycomyces buryatensis]
MAARVRKPGPGRVRASGRGRRKLALAGFAGTLAVAGAAMVVPGALAEQQTDGGLGQAVEQLPVDDSLLGLVDVGETVDVAESLTYADPIESNTVELSEPGASYVKVHFERLLLTDTDYVTVSSPDGAESYRYEESMVDDWATSINGDTAIVELHRTARQSTSAVLGAVVDKAAYGFPEEVLDAVIDDKHDRDRPEESICTDDDKKPSPCYENSYPDVVDHAEPVARLLIDGTILCTAFRVGDRNRMLTNHHCFSETPEAQRTEVWFGYGCTSCDGSGETEPVKVGGKRVVATSKDLDYTLFSVDDFKAVKGFGSLELSDTPATRGEAIYIPQHPAGRPTEIAMESSVDGGNCVVKDAVYDGYVAASDVSYYCDTEFGSSGSPVLSRDTHEVVALHHFGGCPNSGVAAGLIAKDLKNLI